jgi:predicted dehydrogenase
VACVGAGYFSQFHYRAWSRIPGVSCVGACDLDLEAAKATNLPAFDDLANMLEVTKPDILDVILPPSGHAAAIRTAVAAGVKTVICQKPFCLSLQDAEEITDLAEEMGTSLVVHENFRFMPWYRTIKDAIQTGRIGQVMQATFRLRPGDGQGPQAYLDRQPYFQKMPQFLIHETGVHWVDVFRYLFGNPIAVYADLRQLNPVIKGEDAGMVLFDHSEGIRAVLDANRLADHAADNLRRTMGEALFEGTEGSLTLTGDGRVDFRPFGRIEPETILPPDQSEDFGGDCVYHLQSHVVRHIKEDLGLENTARDYLDVIRVRDAIYRSAQTGRKVVM